ncbi:MAG TPA: hypothetical protein VJ482_00170 [Acidimicrobiia bacterium]|nr:hypothetical protein [Acidimicrobiia bacterium]
MTLLVVVSMLVAAMAAPAVASKAPASGADPEEGHKVTICHATRSLTNPYVEVTIDVAAWNNPTDPKHHGDNHTRTKHGITWKDYLLEEGQECSLDRPPLSCELADFVVEFSDDKLVSTTSSQVRLSETVTGLTIPAGTYSLLLGSRDIRQRFLVQNNEQWRAVFSDGSTSLYTADLPDGPANPSLETFGGVVTLTELVTSVTAEHWDVANVSSSPDSVIPDYVCLTRGGGAEL